MAETERKRPRLKDLPGGQVTELIVIVAMALAIALAVQWLLVKPYRIPSGSMEPTLDVGQRVLVNRLSHRLGSDPQVGDVITFHPPAGADETPPRCGAQQADDQPCPAPTSERSKQTFIKRVVGVGGDRIAVRDGHVVRNGRVQSEPFIAPCAGGQGCDLPREITVPRGYVFAWATTAARPTTGASGVRYRRTGSSARRSPPTGPRSESARSRLRGMRRFNLFAASYDYPADQPEGYRRGHARVGEAIGSRRIGGTVYELPPGESAWPYHYELGDEEWLIVLDGRVAVRTPEGEEELERGDVVCFREGPEGAHKMVNRTAEIARVLMLATCRAPAVAVYPDSDKVGVFSEDPGASVMVRRASAVDYWDGEA